ncbi:unnamed protein product [Phaedon cochleariae]|uniref:Uncharacterized protein n=1 Tax=Phaedon cochleariae TaxID=80249 RepID=A0A9N9X2T0_PHACE|nr:unnamed protein product [Phaedon cochleariae]
MRYIATISHRRKIENHQWRIESPHLECIRFLERLVMANKEDVGTLQMTGDVPGTFGNVPATFEVQNLRLVRIRMETLVFEHFRKRREINQDGVMLLSGFSQMVYKELKEAFLKLIPQPELEEDKEEMSLTLTNNMKMAIGVYHADPGEDMARARDMGKMTTG